MRPRSTPNTRRDWTQLGKATKLIYVLDGPRREFEAGLRSLLEQGQRFTVVSLTRNFGEATALMAGFEHSSGQVILTLPAYHQIEGSESNKLVSALSTCDIAVGRRWPRAGGMFERMRRSLFHKLLGWVTGARLRDLGCGARAFSTARARGNPALRRSTSLPGGACRAPRLRRRGSEPRSITRGPLQERLRAA